MALDPSLLPAVPNYGSGIGVRTEFGTLIPPGGRLAAFVRATSVSGDDKYKGYPIYTTLNAGLAQCRSGQPDVVIVLPGHTENVSAADQMSNLVAGTRIVGLGYGTARPTFTWSAAAATFLFDVANVNITNCILYMAGDPTLTAALTVAAPITVSAAGCSFVSCQIHFAVDADQLSTIGITTTAAADDLMFAGCDMHSGTSDGTGITTHIRLVGADRLKMYNCFISGATSSTTVGVVQMLTTASVGVDLRDCVFLNRKAACVNSFTGMTASSGALVRCNFGVRDNATLAGINTGGDLQYFGCLTTNDVAENAAATTPVSA